MTEVSISKYDRIDERSRQLVVDDVVFNLYHTDPYGLWEISTSKGALPECLKDSFTSPGAAKNAIIGYMASKKNIEEKKAERIEKAIYKNTRKRELKKIEEETI